MMHGQKNIKLYNYQVKLPVVSTLLAKV